MAVGGVSPELIAIRARMKARRERRRGQRFAFHILDVVRSMRLTPWHRDVLETAQIRAQARANREEADPS